MDEMSQNYIRTHSLRINSPEISDAQKQNCKWRIAEALDFQEKYDDFDREHCTLTAAQSAEVMAIVNEVLRDD